MLSNRGSRYARVSQSDEAAANESPGTRGARGQASRTRQRFAETVSGLMHAALWVGAALLVIYALDLYNVVFYSDVIDRCDKPSLFLTLILR